MQLYFFNRILVEARETFISYLADRIIYTLHSAQRLRNPFARKRITCVGETPSTTTYDNGKETQSRKSGLRFVRRATLFMKNKID